MIEVSGKVFSRQDPTHHIKKAPDNTITIYPIKDSWNRNEIISLLKEYRNSIIPVGDKEIEYLNEFIKENL